MDFWIHISMVLKPGGPFKLPGALFKGTDALDPPLETALVSLGRSPSLENFELSQIILMCSNGSRIIAAMEEVKTSAVCAFPYSLKTKLPFQISC